MDHSHYLKTNIPNFPRLEEYGFRPDGDSYVLEKDLSETDLYARVRIGPESIDVRVLDRAFDDDYLPFLVRDNPCAAKAEVEALLEEIVASCFTAVDVVSDMTRYMEETYGRKHEEPWPKLPGYYTFKAPVSEKWYAIIMHLPRSRLGLEGDELIDIINVKIAPGKADTLIDRRHYFPSYHMNKKSWITVLLDRDTDLDALKVLIADSFRMVEKPARSGRKA